MQVDGYSLDAQKEKLKRYADNLTKENLVGWDKEITGETVCLVSKL